MSQEKKNPPRFQYRQDGARPKKKDSGTVDPLEYKVFKDGDEIKQILKDGTERKGKSVEKAFVGEDALDDLSERIINAIGSSIRLKILLYLNANKDSKGNPKGISEKEIYDYLKDKYNIINTGLRQNHLKPLVDAGLIQKEESIYWAIPGAMQSLILNISNLTALRNSINEPLSTKDPVIKILGGPQDLEAYELHHNPTLLGRQGNLDENMLAEYRHDIVFNNYYQSVSRVYNPEEPKRSPHAKLVCNNGDWYIEDCRSNSFGTFVNEKKIYKQKKLKDYDIIGLSRGKYSVELLFREPNHPENYNKLTLEEQEKLANRIDILLNKLDPEFFLYTLDKIIDRIRYLQEIESIVPTLKEDEMMDLDSYDEDDKKLAQRILKNMDEEENIDFGNPMVNEYYLNIKTKRRK